MNKRELSIGGCFEDAFDAFKKYPGMAIGGFVIYMAISTFAGMIPFVGNLFQIIAMFPLVGGYMIFTLRILRGENPQIGDIFSGFSEWVRWLGVGWLLFLYVLVTMLICAVPFGILALIAIPFDGPNSAAGIALYIMGGLISYTLIIIVTLRWSFVWYIAADEGATATQAIKKSQDMTEGIRPTIFLISLIAGLFAIAGIIALGVGVFVTYPIAILVMAAVYLAAKETRGDGVPMDRPEVPPAAPSAGSEA